LPHDRTRTTITCVWWRRASALDEGLVQGIVTTVMRIDAKVDEVLNLLRGEDEEELEP